MFRSMNRLEGAEKENNLIVGCHETDTQRITITQMAFTCIPCSWLLPLVDDVMRCQGRADELRDSMARRKRYAGQLLVIHDARHLEVPYRPRSIRNHRKTQLPAHNAISRPRCSVAGILHV